MVQIIRDDEACMASTKRVIVNASYQILYTEYAKNYPNNEHIYTNNLNPLDLQEFEELYFMMEGILIDLCRFKTLPTNVMHLGPQFDNFMKMINGEKNKKRTGCNVVSLVCELYLLIFDTLPVYQCDLFTYEDWRIALTTKKLASLVLDYRLAMGVCYHKDLIRTRSYKLKNKNAITKAN